MCPITREIEICPRCQRLGPELRISQTKCHPQLRGYCSNPDIPSVKLVEGHRCTRCRERDEGDLARRALDTHRLDQQLRDHGVLAWRNGAADWRPMPQNVPHSSQQQDPYYQLPQRQAPARYPSWSQQQAQHPRWPQQPDVAYYDARQQPDRGVGYPGEPLYDPQAQQRALSYPPRLTIMPPQTHDKMYIVRSREPERRQRQPSAVVRFGNPHGIVFHRPL